MSSKDTRLIPSDLTLAICSLLVNGQTPSCYFVASLQSHTFLIFIYMQSATRQVRLDLLIYFQLIFPTPSFASLKF